ncbi:MAG: XTP/dITP diphosphatase [Candidatus ainarchaeum sp.]|nr:XTP/dITP diphosphatase [Candidatus ainarchaeum sp.]
MEISFVTSNPGKFSEAEKILNKYGINIVHAPLHLEEKRSESVEEIAEGCALRAYSALRKPLFVEDSGLFVPALNGFPGTYSAWVLKKLGNEGILRLLDGKERAAEFRCAIAFTEGKDVRLFTGSVRGRVSGSIRGNGGFGYDPVFIPEGEEKTFAEAPSLKDSLSHRARALQKFGESLSRK